MASALAERLTHLKKRGKMKPKKVTLSRKGVSFTIKHPGAFRAKAKAAGMSTKAFAQQHTKGKSVTARQARAAIGLMAMSHKR